MTNYQIGKIRDCLAVILDQVKMLSYYGALVEQRKERLEKIEGRVLWIRDILKDEKKALKKKSGIALDNRKGVKSNVNDR